MGLGIVEDGFGCAAGNQLLKNKAVAHILRACVQLAVGESTCAALTELDIALRVQRAVTPKARHRLAALLHRLATLQHNGAQAALCQHQRGEEAAGAHAHHHRGNIAGSGCGQVVFLGFVYRHPLVAAAAQHLIFVLHRHRHRVDELQALAGVNGAAEDAEVGDLFGAAA